MCFIYLLVTCVSSFEKCLLRFFVYFSIRLFVFLQLHRAPYIFVDINSSPDICFAGVGIWVQWQSVSLPSQEQNKEVEERREGFANRFFHAEDFFYGVKKLFSLMWSSLSFVALLSAFWKSHPGFSCLSFGSHCQANVMEIFLYGLMSSIWIFNILWAVLFFFCKCFKSIQSQQINSHDLRTITYCCLLSNRNISYNPIQKIQVNQFDYLSKLKSL